MKEETEETFSYDVALKQVEEIIEKLQSSDVSSIDNEMTDIEKALELTKKCEEHLKKTNAKLDKLFEENSK